MDHVVPRYFCAFGSIDIFACDITSFARAASWKPGIASTLSLTRHQSAKDIVQSSTITDKVGDFCADYENGNIPLDNGNRQSKCGRPCCPHDRSIDFHRGSLCCCESVRSGGLAFAGWPWRQHQLINVPRRWAWLTRGRHASILVILGQLSSLLPRQW